MQSLWKSTVAVLKDIERCLGLSFELRWISHLTACKVAVQRANLKDALASQLKTATRLQDCCKAAASATTSATTSATKLINKSWTAHHCGH